MAGLTRPSRLLSASQPLAGWMAASRACSPAARSADRGGGHDDVVQYTTIIPRRGVAHHKVSRNGLPLYVVEFHFRYNNRISSISFGGKARRGY